MFVFGARRANNVVEPVVIEPGAGEIELSALELLLTSTLIVVAGVDANKVLGKVPLVADEKPHARTILVTPSISDALSFYCISFPDATYA